MRGARGREAVTSADLVSYPPDSRTEKRTPFLRIYEGFSRSRRPGVAQMLVRRCAQCRRSLCAENPLFVDTFAAAGKMNASGGRAGLQLSRPESPRLLANLPPVRHRGDSRLYGGSRVLKTKAQRVEFQELSEAVSDIALFLPKMRESVSAVQHLAQATGNRAGNDARDAREDMAWVIQQAVENLGIARARYRSFAAYINQIGTASDIAQGGGQAAENGFALSISVTELLFERLAGVAGYFRHIDRKTKKYQPRPFDSFLEALDTALPVDLMPKFTEILDSIPEFNYRALLARIRRETSVVLGPDGVSVGSESELQGVSLYDICLHIEDGDDAAAKNAVKEWSNSKTITATPIGKCPVDGRRYLYRLSEILSDAKKKWGYRVHEIHKLSTAISTKLRAPVAPSTPESCTESCPKLSD